LSVARYLYGDQIDKIVARWNANEHTSWHLSNRLGTVGDVVDHAGIPANHIEYSAFGNILSQMNPTHTDRFTFTGREFDTATGLYYFRGRYYSASIGRFVSEDPIAFLGNDANLARYAANAPTQWTDPFGYSTLRGYLEKG
jgi:RHS repeat-associated protein